MLNQFLEYLFVFVLSFYFCIVSYGKYGELLGNTEGKLLEIEQSNLVKIWTRLRCHAFPEFLKVSRRSNKNEWDNPRTAIPWWTLHSVTDTTIP